jgi:hypothetical protein
MCEAAADSQFFNHSIVHCNTPAAPGCNRVRMKLSRFTKLTLYVEKSDLELIDFKYKNLPGGGRAKVQVWGK